ncbi:DUF6285 domain-containing protein [Ilumatobacter nonamiensis]|uniref:DUF6285 domain-containing protein n=1 Tax=Ilumatobacter nonamiensis TaxID=467093 RepID=UPI00034C0DED|nr:DUF6285 domain-containing protein [Ilumatobacter nonamiensis]
MQNEPEAADILAVVAEVLAQEIVPQLSGSAQHHARVAANLLTIVERELLLAGENDRVELQHLAEIVGDECPDDLRRARRAVSTSLRTGFADEPRRFAEVWGSLVDAVRNDLAIAKPGYDDWEAD